MVVGEGVGKGVGDGMGEGVGRGVGRGVGTGCFAGVGLRPGVGLGKGEALGATLTGSHFQNLDNSVCGKVKSVMDGWHDTTKLQIHLRKKHTLDKMTGKSGDHQMWGCGGYTRYGSLRPTPPWGSTFTV